MEPPSEQQQSWKKMKKQLTAKRDDTPLQSLVRTGSVELVLDMISSYGDMELREMLSKMNQSGETALYVAAEYGYVDVVREMIRYHDTSLAGIKARNGYDAFHIAAKQGCLGKLFNFHLNMQYPVFTILCLIYFKCLNVVDVMSLHL